MICCYLLKSKNRTYVGYTVSIKRRLKQHNGILKGGARYTKMFRPWKLNAVVVGFKSKTEAMQFEWAWKHPRKSRFGKGLHFPRDRLQIAKKLITTPYFHHLKLIKI